MLTLAAADPMAVVSMISTIVLAILTGIYVSLTHRLVLASTDPCVIVTVEKDEARQSLMMLIVENVGPGLARDVRFEMREPLPFRVYPGQEPQLMKDGPLIEGIPALGPGGRRVISWGSFRGLNDMIGDKQFKITCYFKRAAGMFERFNQECEPVECVLDIRSYYQLDAVDTDGARITAKELEKLNRQLQQITAGQTPLPVRVTELPSDSVPKQS